MSATGVSLMLVREDFLINSNGEGLNAGIMVFVLLCVRVFKGIPACYPEVS